MDWESESEPGLLKEPAQTGKPAKKRGEETGNSLEDLDDWKPEHPEGEHRSKAFRSIEEFCFFLSVGQDVMFRFRRKRYRIAAQKGNRFLVQSFKDGELANGLTLEELLEFRIDRVQLRDAILKAAILERNL